MIVDAVIGCPFGKILEAGEGVEVVGVEEGVESHLAR